MPSFDHLFGYAVMLWVFIVSLAMVFGSIISTLIGEIFEGIKDLRDEEGSRWNGKR
jgi:hypothetical protein